MPSTKPEQVVAVVCAASMAPISVETVDVDSSVSICCEAVHGGGVADDGTLAPVPERMAALSLPSAGKG